MTPSTTLRDTRTVGRISRLARRYREVRRFSERLARPLTPEDMVIQSMPEASPTRWHLAHTTWFFENFVLKRAAPDYTSAHPAFDYLFNSYYNLVGRQFPRGRRGILSRPTVAEVLDYRRTVDEQMTALLDSLAKCSSDEAASHDRVIEMGLHHEQQHQELILTDIKHALSGNPLFPVYETRADEPRSREDKLAWISFDAGLRRIGHAGRGFAFDNESPRHRVYLNDFLLADRLVTNAEFLAFIDDGGYTRPELWLSEGWETVQAGGWNAPGYWHRMDGQWHQFTLAGLRPVEPNEPLCHASYFEADAYARWTGARLPSEAEWETAARGLEVEGNLASSERFHPRPAADRPNGQPRQMFGDVWEWTSSAYAAYPGFRAPEGALGEYNAKFMCNQFVLRGGSCATPDGHIRRTYRNFFAPDARWQFSGLRLARDA